MLGAIPHAHGAEDRSSLTNFDKRVIAAKAATRAEQAAAHEKLKERVPDAAADFDPLLGSPKWVHSRGGTLTGAKGEGRGVSAETAKRFDQDPDKALKAFMHEHRALFRHGAEILEGAVKKRDHATPQGLRSVVWQQQVDGIPVFDSVLVANTTAGGELVSVSSQFIPEPQRAADRGTPNRAAKAKPPINAENALRRAATNVAEAITEVLPMDDAAVDNLRQRFNVKPLPDDATAELIWVPLNGDTLRLCWMVELTRREFSERFRFIVDSETGEILVRRKLTLDASEVLYNVFTSDSPSPFSPGYWLPTNAQPPFVERQLLTLSNVNATASPLGWVNPGALDPRGNNVDARLDRDADNRPDLPRVQGTLDASNRLVLDFPLDLNQNPTNYSAAAVVQLFYWCNWMHDRLYDLGFTESAGNYQKDNFGRGGIDNDPMLADAQDGSGFNNANFTPAPDGLPARIQMFVFNSPTPARDGDFDAEVILHEYAHGLSERLVGGGVGIWQLQSFGMGEGWSDFYAESLLSDPSDDLGANYPMGGYVTYQFNGLGQNYYYGIRRYPYSTNLSVNPLTFKDIDPNRASTHPGVPRNPIIVSLGNEVHRQGEVWCSMLWDMRANLLTKYAPTNAIDYTNANMKVLRYVTLGLQLSPPNPNFVQARDAILLAVRLTPGSGTDTNEVWAAFARRGLGRSAICPDTSTTFGVVEAYDTPERPEFDVFPAQPPYVNMVGPYGGPFEPHHFTNTLVSGSPTNLPWAAAVNQPWLQLSQTNGIIPAKGSLEHVVSINSAANALSAGMHQAVVYYTNLVRTQVVSRIYSLQVLSEQTNAMTVTPSGPLLIRVDNATNIANPTEYVYRISNNKIAPFRWHAYSTNEWLTVIPTNGILAVTPAITEVTVTVNTNIAALIPGTHSGELSFVNLDTSNRVDIPVSLRVGAVDHLTEVFTNAPFPLAYSSLTFTPDFSEDFYRICRDPAFAFPTDPANGVIVPLADDEYRQVGLINGATVSVFGTSSNAIFIGANGNLTFDPGPPVGHFQQGAFFHFAAARASALYGDLNPAAGGTVSYLQLTNRFVVTYENVPEFTQSGVNNTNNLQIELFYDGRIRFTWLRVDFENQAGGQGAPVVGLSRGLGMPADFEQNQSDFGATGTCTPPITLLLPARATEGDGFHHGTLIFNAPLTNDLRVTLTSSDPDEVAVPEFIVLTPFPGQTAYDFGIAVIDEGILDGTQPAIITANFPQGPPASAKMLVDDAPSGGGVLSFNIQPSTGLEGNVLAGAGVVRANVVAQKPITVDLESDNPTRVSVPPTVTIPAGEQAAAFDVMLVDNNLVDGSEGVIVRASIVNWKGDLDAVGVADNESRALQLTMPRDVLESEGILLNAGRVSLGGIAVSNVVIALQSDRPMALWVPAFVTNVAGQSNVRFSLVVSNNAIIDTFSALNITARATGFLTATGIVEWVDDERPFVPSNPVPLDFETHVPRNTTLNWTVNTHAPTTTVYNVYLGTNADLSTLSPIASTTDRKVSLPFHLDPEKTYYWQVIGRLDPLPAVESPVWQFTTATLGFRFGEIASPQFIGEPFQLEINAVDEYDLAVTNYRGRVTLTNVAPRKSSSTIVISEMDTVAFGRVEFANVSGRAIDIAGWQISLFDSINWPNPAVVYTIPGPSVAAPDDLFNIRSLPLPLFPGRYPNFGTGTNVAWNNNPVNNPIAVLLRDNVGNIVDFVCAADADPRLISVPATVPPEHWTGAAVRVNIDSSLTYQRVGNSDQNSSNDWTIARWSIATNNVGMTLPFTNRVVIPFAASEMNDFINGICTGAAVMFDEAQDVQFGLTDGAGRGALSDPFDVFARDDLALSGSGSSVVFVDQPIVYHFAITNTGPAPAVGVKLIDALGPHVLLSSAEASQGSCSITNDVVVCDLGSVSPNSMASVTIQAKAMVRGNVTNFASVARGEPDGYLPNNTVTLSTTVIHPQVTILDATNAEPNAGSSLMTFTLRLSAPNTLTSRVAYATSDGSARAAADYEAASGVVMIPPGSTNVTLTVPIRGDFLNEFNENFFVNLLSATNLDIIRPFAVGTIADNDPLPGVSITDATIMEPDAGSTNVVFTVSLSAPSGRTVALNYSTANGSAVAGLDYIDAYGSVTFAPGSTNETITVPILDDSFAEPAKTFHVNLANSGNAIITRNIGVGTILDSDLAGIDHFTFEPLGGTHYAGTSLPIAVAARDGNGDIAAAFKDPVRLLAFDSPRSVSIGSNNFAWSFPFGSSFHDSRLQSIYLTNEIGSAGTIVGVALDVATAPAQTLNHWTIRTRHTPNALYASGSWESAGWVTNFQHQLTMVSNGWVTFPFSTPFPYNGREHLMIDFSFNNGDFSADGLARSSSVTFPRSLYLRSDSGLGQPMDWSGHSPTGTLAPRVLNVHFIMARDVPLQPFVLTNFVNGVAVETVSLQAPATNVILRAVDSAGHIGDSAPFSSIALRISSVVRDGNSMTVHFPTLKGSRYVVESRVALQSEWTMASPIILGDGTVVQFRDVPPSQQQFYRVRLVP